MRVPALVANGLLARSPEELAGDPLASNCQVEGGLARLGNGRRNEQEVVTGVASPEQEDVTGCRDWSSGDFLSRPGRGEDGPGRRDSQAEGPGGRLPGREPRAAHGGRGEPGEHPAHRDGLESAAQRVGDARPPGDYRGGEEAGRADRRDATLPVPLVGPHRISQSPGTQ